MYDDLVKRLRSRPFAYDHDGMELADQGVEHDAANAIVALQAGLAAARAEIERLKTRPESEAAQSIAIVREFLRRVTHWQEGKPDCHDAMEALDKADDDVDWIEHGIVEWRDVALKAQSDLAAANERIQQLSRQKEQWISDWSDACNEEQRALNLAGLAEAECRKMRSERDKLLADLAAARALLREAALEVAETDLRCRIDATLEGKK